MSLTEKPTGARQSFFNFPLQLNLDSLKADFAVLGVPYGVPYGSAEWPNDQAKAPDWLRNFGTDEDVSYNRNHYDYDLGGLLLGEGDVQVVDCGNVTFDHSDPQEHYRRAEQVAKKILSSGSVLITLGGDHGVPIPIMRALEVLHQELTLIHIDAHLDWRNDIGGETEGYSSPIRRASEMPWIKDIVQIGMRGIGSARPGEVEAAKTHGAKVITAYEMHEMGIDKVLDEIPDGGPYYLSIDADGIDPTIMPAVLAQTPGGLNWLQLRALIHGLLSKGRVAGMDLVEIAPSYDVGKITAFHAERLLCNFIGASVRNNHLCKPLN